MDEKDEEIVGITALQDDNCPKCKLDVLEGQDGVYCD